MTGSRKIDDSELQALGLTPEQCAALDEPIESFGLLEVDPATGEQRLTEHIASKLRPDVAAYVLALATRGREESAKAIANCYKVGIVSTHCQTRDYARGYRWRCKDKGCVHCGQPKVQLAAWVRSRDFVKLSSEPQIGMQLSLHPFDAETHEEKRCASKSAEQANPEDPDLDQLQEIAWNPQAVLHTLRRLRASFLRLSRKLRFDYLAVDEIDYRGSLVGIRVVCRLRHADVRAIARTWHQIEPNSLCRLYVDANPQRVLLWAFLGLGSIPQIEPKKRAEFTKLYEGDRSVRASQRFYGRLSDEEWEILERSHEGHSDSEQCPCCLARGRISEMEEIPSFQRKMETVESIHAQYQIVDWDWGRRVDLRRL